MMSIGLFVLIWSFKLVVGKQEGFIVGGDYVDSIRKFPHVAFLTLQTKSDDVFICGSSILNQIILITAAHCLDGIILITASVGNVDREKGKMYYVKRWEQHKNWNTINMNYDIALCKLKKPLVLGQNVQRVVLMQRPPTARIADLAGWGAVEERGYSDTMQLKHTRQKLWSRDTCKNIINSAPVGTICGGEQRAKGNFAAKGDSGSGLLVNNKIIVGLVSYKEPSVSRSLAVYTDVTYFYKWIERTADRLSCA